MCKRKLPQPPFQVSHILHKARDFTNCVLPTTQEFKKLLSCWFVLMKTDEMLSDLNSEDLAAGRSEKISQ